MVLVLVLVLVLVWSSSFGHAELQNHVPQPRNRYVDPALVRDAFSDGAKSCVSVSFRHGFTSSQHSL